MSDPPPHGRPIPRRALLAAGATALTAGCGRTLRYADELEGSPTRTGTSTYSPGEGFWEGPLWVHAINGRPDTTATFAVTIERVSCGSRPTADGSACDATGESVYEGTLRAPGIDTGDDGSYSGMTVSLYFEADGGTVVSGPEFAVAEGVVAAQGDYRVTVEAADQRRALGIRAHAGVRGIEAGIDLDGELLVEAETEEASGAFSEPGTVTGSGTPGDRDRPT
ncbi:hypothetical protein [Haloglomus litoreum]|uniref:hypothetical protein n=1 Tax=Haloglomus litoreum TaxID=3034026 RepID=UPI0023E880B1|nr:hypothetical protein [Haloglomus sp. DT116]